MKKLMAMALTAVFAVSLTACSSNVTTKDDVKPAESAPASTEQAAASSEKPAEQAPTVDIKPAINIVATATMEKQANIVRDQLAKNGFEPKITLQPDSASVTALVEAGNFDINITSWTTVTGNPDYAIRSLAKTDGDYNRGGIADEKVDELIEKAATETPEQFVSTYKELEEYMIGEKAYFVPLYRSIKTQGVNVEILKPETVRLSKSRAMCWEMIEFQDSSKNDTEPMISAQAASSLTSLDPVRGNDGSINQLNTNMYVRIVNLTDDDRVVPDGSLSHNYVIKDDNNVFYFVLRDDINFAKVENMDAVDTGVRVGAEDVVFSLNRAKDKNSAPVHKTYSLHENMQSIEIVTDLAELESTTSSNGKSVKEEMEERTPSEITALTDDKTAVDNAAGTYQVVKITTKFPFPQVLNYLAHQSAGIVSQQQVESINTFDVASYDPATIVAYGDQVAVTEGATYDNHLWCSGPYIMTVKNDYEAKFVKNPAYMPGTEYNAKIKHYTQKFIADQDSQLSALRAGEIYVLYSVPEAKIDLVTSDSKLTLQEVPSNGVYYCTMNVKGSMSDENLRKAVLYSINQDEIQAVYANRVEKAYSTISPLVDTGNVLVADAAKVAENLAAYAANLNK